MRPQPTEEYEIQEGLDAMSEHLTPEFLEKQLVILHAFIGRLPKETIMSLLKDLPAKEINERLKEHAEFIRLRHNKPFDPSYSERSIEPTATNDKLLQVIKELIEEGTLKSCEVEISNPEVLEKLLEEILYREVGSIQYDDGLKIEFSNNFNNDYFDLVQEDIRIPIDIFGLKFKDLLATFEKDRSVIAAHGETISGRTLSFSEGLFTADFGEEGSTYFAAEVLCQLLSREHEVSQSEIVSETNQAATNILNN